jgi:hypothetical protein
MVGTINHQASSRCQAGALILFFLHIVTVSAMAYQDRLGGDYYGLIINYGLWLSPALAILIFRRSCPFVGLYAGPILIDFAARMYFAWDYYWTGVNSIWPKGDWAGWFTTFMGMASLVVLACWLIVMAGVVLIHLINRLRQLKGG